MRTRESKENGNIGAKYPGESDQLARLNISFPELDV